MATPAQIQANQSNAHRSTGPRTAEGKARSAANSTRHGFCSQSVLLPGDDPAEYQVMLEDLRAHFGPKDITEDRTVREMADAEWRLRRVRQHQEALLTDACVELAAADPSLDAARLQVRAFDHLLAKSSTLAALMRYETKFERQYDRAYRAWVVYQEKQGRREERELVRPARLPTELASPQAFLKLLPPEVQERLSRFARPPAHPESVTSTVLPNEPNPTLPFTYQIARNAPCPCGSGVKYKRCCGRHAPTTSLAGREYQPKTVA